MSSVDKYAYTVESRRVADTGNYVPHVICRCGQCTNKLEFVLGSTTPETIAKKIGAQGWRIDLNNKKWTRCPRCIEINFGRRAGESPKEPAVVSMLGKPVALPSSLVPPGAAKVETTNDNEEEQRPTKEYRIRLRSPLSFAALAKVLHNPLIDLQSIAVVEPQPQVAEVAPAPEVKAEEKPAAAEPASNPRKGVKLVLTPEAVASKRKAFEASYGNYLKNANTLLTEIRRDHPSIDIETAATKMNELGLLKPWGKGAKTGWTSRNLLTFWAATTIGAPNGDRVGEHSP